MARVSVFSARHFKSPVFSTSLPILPSGRRRCLVSTDVVLSSLLRQLITIPLHLSWTATQKIPGMESLHSHSVLFFVSALYVLPSTTSSFKLRPPYTPLPKPERSFCCIHQGNNDDRTYLRCCPARAWNRLRCLEGVREGCWLCSITFADFH